MSPVFLERVSTELGACLFCLGACILVYSADGATFMRLNLSFFEELLYGPEPCTNSRPPSTVPLTSRSYTKSPELTRSSNNVSFMSDMKSAGPDQSYITSTPQALRVTQELIGAYSHMQTPSDLNTFDTLYTDAGLKNLKSWFMAHSDIDNNLTEDQFILFLRKLTHFPDHRILEVFDLFGELFFRIKHLNYIDLEDAGVISFSEYFVLVSMLAGLESGKCLQVLCVTIKIYIKF